MKMPAFYNGYLYSCEPHNIATVFAPDGQVLLALPIQGAGNGKTSILAVAIDSDGTLAVSWRDPPSAGIDIRDTTGKLVRTIETGRYVPLVGRGRCAAASTEPGARAWRARDTLDSHNQT